MARLNSSILLHYRPTARTVVQTSPPKLTKYDYVISQETLERCQTIHNSLQQGAGRKLRVLYVTHHTPHRQRILSGLRGFKSEQLIGYFNSNELSQLLEV